MGCQDRRTCPLWDHPRFLGVTLVYDFSTKMWSYFSYLDGASTAQLSRRYQRMERLRAKGHGYTETEIINLGGAGDFSGFHIVQESPGLTLSK